MSENHVTPPVNPPADVSYASLTFPLNVYAQVLELDQGHVDYLHYGLFEAESDDIATAQERSTALIIDRLPPPPARILEIGVGLGTTAGALARRGYRVTAITPDSAQIALAKARCGVAVELICTRFEEWTPGPEGFDALLLQESAQYLDALQLFNKARRVLTDDGMLIMIDEVALKRTTVGVEGLHVLKHLLAQAQRCGFALEEQQDLSQQARPTVDYLLRTIGKHRSALLTRLHLRRGELDALEASLRRYRERYQQAHFGYALLCLRKKDAPRWEIRAAHAADVPAILGLFEKVFQHPMSEALWHWKYGHGRGSAILGWRAGQLVAHYGGMGRDAVWQGQRIKAVQVGDVMVASSERGVLTRKGPFFLTAATFLERSIGYGLPYLLGFGFPTERAMRVAERMGLYAEVGKMVEVRWPVAPARPRLFTRVRHLGPTLSARDRKYVDDLWSQMRTDFQETIIGVRDAEHVQHRYLAHPEKRYEVLLVYNRLGGRPRGLVVLRRDAERYVLLDIVAQKRAFPMLLGQARRLAAMWGAQQLSAWISEPHANLLAGVEGEVVPLDVRIPTCAWTEGPAPEAVRDKWWLTSGDTDFS